jgi:hypothetical protein
VAKDYQDLLTPEAREAIRGFVWTLVVPSAVVLAVLSAIAGFFVKDWALTDANAQLVARVEQEITAADNKLQKALDDGNQKLQNLLMTTLTPSNPLAIRQII